MKTRPDSALMNEMTPIGVPDAAVIGTLIAERMPMSRSSSRCSGSCDRRLEQLVGDVGDQLRVAVAQHLRRAALVARAARVALAVAAREGDLLGIAVGDRDLLDDAVAVGHAHAAPVGERGHGEVGDVLQRALVVQRGRERRAGAREQPLRLLRAPLLGDVLDHRHHQPRLAARVADAARLVHAPALLARRAVDDAQPLRRRPPRRAARGRRGTAPASAATRPRCRSRRARRGPPAPRRAARRPTGSRASRRRPRWRRRGAARDPGPRPPRRGC